MDVSKNSGFSPQSSILIGLSIVNHPFRGTPIFGNTHVSFREGIFFEASPSSSTGVCFFSGSGHTSAPLFSLYSPCQAPQRHKNEAPAQWLNKCV